MPDEKKPVLLFPGSTRLSFDVFLASVQDRRRHLEEREGALWSAYALLYSGETISSDFCDDLLHCIEAMREPLEHFCAFLDGGMHLPVTVATWRTLAFLRLHQMDDLVDDLTIRVPLLQTAIRQLSPKRIVTQRREVQQRLGHLLEYSEALEHLVETLPEQTLFHSPVLATP